MGIKIVTKNKKASFDFALQERFEAGLVLHGTEVKSIRLGKAQIADAYVRIDETLLEAWIYNMTIPHYDFGNRFNHEETRKRKLLLNKKEIEHIKHVMKTQNLTLVPTSLYFKESLIKLEIALAKGKKMHDKRQDDLKKGVERKLRQADYT